MIALKLKFHTITKKFFSKKSYTKLPKFFKLYLKYMKSIYIKYYYLGFFSYKLSNYIILL